MTRGNCRAKQGSSRQRARTADALSPTRCDRFAAALAWPASRRATVAGLPPRGGGRASRRHRHRRGACGANGSACIQRDPPRPLCGQGCCQCDANNCPNGCCESGPGQTGFCRADDPHRCGVGGVACAGCPAGTVRHAAAQCRWTGPSCPAGTVCRPGEECCAAKFDGGACALDGALCSGNCLSRVCAETVDQCGNTRCDPPAKGCAGDTCCDTATAACCGDTCCDTISRVCCGGAGDGKGECCDPATSTCCGDHCCLKEA